MLINYPDVLLAPFAFNGAKNPIPLDPASGPYASLTTGFPKITELPISAGGIPPQKDDFNGILNIISQHTCWQQSGGHYYWWPMLDYELPALVFGSNGKIYIALEPSGPNVAGVGAKDPTAADSEAYWLDYAASFKPEKYDLAQYYWFEDEMPRLGLFSCLGGLIENFSRTFPKAAAYFETSYGQKRLVTQAQYDALHVYSWHTNSDGSKVGWNGIGGVNKFVWDKEKGTLRLPDLAGMTPEQVGYDPLGVGGVRPDQIRNFSAYIKNNCQYHTNVTGAFYTGVASGEPWSATNGGGWSGELFLDPSRVVPVGPRNHGPRWVSDARVYLGVPLL